MTIGYRENRNFDVNHFIRLSGLKKAEYVVELNMLRGELNLPKPKLTMAQLGVKLGSTFASKSALTLHRKFVEIYGQSLSARERQFFDPDSAEVTYAVFVECLASMKVIPWSSHYGKRTLSSSTRFRI